MGVNHYSLERDRKRWGRLQIVQNIPIGFSAAAVRGKICGGRFRNNVTQPMISTLGFQISSLETCKGREELVDMQMERGEMTVKSVGATKRRDLPLTYQTLGIMEQTKYGSIGIE